MLATPAWAEEVLPAPDYFVDSAMATSTAQVLARSCTRLSVNPVEMTRHGDAVLDALARDGFTAENLATRMADPSTQVAVQQRTFLQKHDLTEGASEAEVCVAGLREIAEGTNIGKLLVEVEE
nr:DUF5333 family protein [Jannaschia sp. S6380]